jgi:hypothetical protein
MNSNTQTTNREVHHGRQITYTRLEQEDKFYCCSPDAILAVNMVDMREDESAVKSGQ